MSSVPPEIDPEFDIDLEIEIELDPEAGLGERLLHGGVPALDSRPGAHLRRAWLPLQPTWQEPEHAVLGIGVISCNRRSQVEWLVEALRVLTRTPFHLVIADDGSEDGTAAWARESGIPVVTGRNRGVAWNKNRALYWLMHRTRCEKLLLIEDDIYPVRPGWEQGWLEALDHLPHLNYTAEDTYPHAEAVIGQFQGYPVLNCVGGSLMAMTRAGVRKVGFLDTRFQGYGVEHVEYTQRFRHAGLHPQPGFVTLRDGSLSGHGPWQDPVARAEQIRYNQGVHYSLADEPLWRPPARGHQETEALAHEQQRATWPVDARKSAGAERVSVLCASRSENLARRMAASFGSDPLVEFVWAWNGPERPDLPGIVLDYSRRPFNYCEAYNQAARYAAGRVLLLINDDVEITCGELPRRLLDLYHRHPDLGIAYGGLPGEWQACEDPAAPAWEGCCWAISREAFHAMGGLEEALTGFGGDEFVATVRMLRLGYRGLRLRGWTYHHLGHQTYGQAGPLQRNWRQFPMELGWGVAAGVEDADLARLCPDTLEIIRAAEPRHELLLRAAAGSAEQIPGVLSPPAPDLQAALPGASNGGTALPAVPRVIVPADSALSGPAELQLLTGSAPLGIGVITYNRLEQVRRCVEAIRSLTRTPYHLVIADDGSEDGTAAWARESGLPVVTGRNRGVAWNKNRALYWLMHRTRCEKLLLIEDDIYPVRPGWEQGWLEALDRFPHLNLSPPAACPGGTEKEAVVATYAGYPALNWVGGVLMAMTRKGMETVGYLDTRFQGYGREHRDLTERYQRAGLHPPEGYLTLRDGSLSEHGACIGEPERVRQWFRNCTLAGEIAGEPVWRPPARGTEERAALLEEQQAAWEQVRQVAPGAAL
jgi:glycosyltransferase involved in cell wall biosynthesis